MAQQLRWQHENGQLMFSGELTRATVTKAWQQRKQWRPSQGQQLTIDLAEVSLVDTAGVAMLLQLKKYLLQHQCELSLRQASQQLKDITAVSGGSELLGLAD